MRCKIFCRFAASRLAGVLALLLLFSLLLPSLALAQEAEPRHLRVAFSPLEGISEVDKYGIHRGLMVDYLNEIAKYTGWVYDYVEAEPAELVDRFIAGDFDLMGATFYSPGFERYFGYPEYDMGRSIALLLCNREDESLRSYDLHSMNGKTIGVYENAAEKIRYLQEYLDINELSCELRYYKYEDQSADGDLYEQLRRGEIDMLLGNESEGGGEFRVVTSFQAQPYYIVTQPGETELIAQLNSALAHIQESTPGFAEAAFNDNFPDIKTSDMQLNEAERAFIAEKKIITVAVPRSWHPIYCEDSGFDHHDGLLPDMLSELQSFTGISFSYVYADSYAESIRLVQEGEADILGAFLGDAEHAFAAGLSLSTPYVELSNIVLKHKTVSYPGENLTCGILEGRTLPPEFSAAQVRSYSTTREMLEAVNSGVVDYIYGVAALLEQEMQARRYVNVVPVSHVSDSTDVSFALAQPVAPELLTILNKAISNMTTAERTALLNRNLVSVGYTTLSLRDLIYDNPVAFGFIIFFLLAAIVTAVLLIARNRMRNALMQSRLNAAEAKSVAKSEFLSRMSHEIRTPMNAIVGLADLTSMEEDLSPAVEVKLQKLRNSSRYLLSLINDILDMSSIENGKMVLDSRNFSLCTLVQELEEMMGSQAAQKGLNFTVDCRAEHEWLVGDPMRLRQILTNLLSNAIKFTLHGGNVRLCVEELSCEDEVASFRLSVADDGIGIADEDKERIFASFEQVSASRTNSVGTGLGLPISRSMARLMGGDLNVRSELGRGSEFYMTVSLPLGQEEVRAPAPQWQEKSLEGLRALLAEDNDLNAEIATELLAAHGVIVTRAVDGQDAVDKFCESEPRAFQVVLMDILMPRKDGYQAALDIRNSGRPDADVPIVAMTANSFKEDEERAADVGMNGFVPKPVDVAQLLRVLRNLT